MKLFLVTSFALSLAASSTLAAPQVTAPSARSPQTAKTTAPRPAAAKPAAVKPAASQPVAPKPARELPKWQLVTDNWDWAGAMKNVTKGFTGTEGVVLHIGDSITYSANYGRWARKGKMQSGRDRETLAWMHTEKRDDTDGWYLAASDVKEDDKALDRSYTAATAMRLDQAIAGGYHGLPSIQQLMAKYNPQIVVLMLGTSDAMADRPVEAYKADLAKAVQTILDNNTIPVLSTIPPNIKKMELVQAYNTAIVQVAKEDKVPLIDFYGEILSRQPGTAWNGTLISKDGLQPSVKVGEVDAAGDPYPDNLKRVGYLLRGWLTVQKIAVVKNKVIDPAAAEKAKEAK